MSDLSFVFDVDIEEDPVFHPTLMMQMLESVSSFFSTIMSRLGFGELAPPPVCVHGSWRENTTVEECVCEEGWSTSPDQDPLSPTPFEYCNSTAVTPESSTSAALKKTAPLRVLILLGVLVAAAVGIVALVVYCCCFRSRRKEKRRARREEETAMRIRAMSGADNRQQVEQGPSPPPPLDAPLQQPQQPFLQWHQYLHQQQQQQGSACPSPSYPTVGASRKQQQQQSQTAMGLTAGTRPSVTLSATARAPVPAAPPSMRRPSLMTESLLQFEMPLAQGTDDHGVIECGLPTGGFESIAAGHDPSDAGLDGAAAYHPLGGDGWFTRPTAQSRRPSAGSPLQSCLLPGGAAERRRSDGSFLSHHAPSRWPRHDEPHVSIFGTGDEYEEEEGEDGVDVVSVDVGEDYYSGDDDDDDVDVYVDTVTGELVVAPRRSTAPEDGPSDMRSETGCHSDRRGGPNDDPDVGSDVRGAALPRYDGGHPRYSVHLPPSAADARGGSSRLHDDPNRRRSAAREPFYADVHRPAPTMAFTTIRAPADVESAEVGVSAEELRQPYPAMSLYRSEADSVFHQEHRPRSRGQGKSPSPGYPFPRHEPFG